MPVKRHRLRKSEVKRLAEELGRRFGAAAPELAGKAVELLELEDQREVVEIEDEPMFFRTDRGLFPTLRALDRIRLGRVVIDMGAVPHVARGAHVMAPGVVRADEWISQGDTVAVVDERHGKSIAVGVALVAGPLMRSPRGRVVENLHHVGDAVWKLFKKS